MVFSRRLEVLLDPERYEILEEVARARRLSIGELIRQAIDQAYCKPTAEDKEKAIKALFAEDADFGEWDDLKREIVESVVGRLEAS